MQKNRFILVFVLSCLASSTLFSQATSWHKQFAASIDKYPITLHLHKYGSNYTGFYYYDKTQHPAYVSGSDSIGEQPYIFLYAYVPGNNESTEIFRLNITGDSIYGKWEQQPQGKTLPVMGKLRSVPGLSFAFVFSEGKQTLRPSLPDSPEATFDAASVWPEGTSKAIPALRKKINEFFGVKNSTAPIGTTLLARKKEMLQTYLNDFKDETDSTIMEFPSGFSQAESQMLTVVYHSARTLTLSDFNYSFTGGAHGNYATSFTVFNLLTGNEVSLNQVVNAAGKKMLDKLIEKNFRKQYNVKGSDPLTEGGLFEDKITANNNFFITGKGIGFNYAPYEIGPYAMGEISIFITFDELKGGLQPAYASGTP